MHVVTDPMHFEVRYSHLGPPSTGQTSQTHTHLENAIISFGMKNKEEILVNKLA